MSPLSPPISSEMPPHVQLRFRLVYALLAALLLPIGYATVRAVRDRPPKPVAPEAVALVRRYLEALRQGDQSGACRIFSVPSVCAAGVEPRLERFTVSSAKPTVGGMEVAATMDTEQAVFQLAGGPTHYRIVDVVADPAPPGLAGPP
jgi:hypothetical protein